MASAETNDKDSGFECNVGIQINTKEEKKKRLYVDLFRYST
jgi:hypothetical protein